MATSTCIKCGHHRFELKEAPRLANTDYKYQLVQCASCGGVVGVLDWLNIGALLERMAKALKINLR